MAITNKIKALLNLRGIKAIAYSKALKLSNPQALNTKYIRESFKIQDLIILGSITKTKLAFVDENNNPVMIFDEQDLKKEE